MKLSAIPLEPDAARVGLSVRVPGSDAGEKLAVLSGIIARIDRPAANYVSWAIDVGEKRRVPDLLSFCSRARVPIVISIRKYYKRLYIPSCQ